MSSRLSGPERRRQLLTAAATIARRDGTDALTLATVATEAGVSRPIAYEHFNTRSGLLTALYEVIADRQHEITLATLADGAQETLSALADRVGAAFMRCYKTAGPEAFAIAASLRGDDLMIATQRELAERDITAFTQAFARVVDLDTTELRTRFVAIVAAGEALSELMLAGEVSEKVAATRLASLIVAWLREAT